MRPERSSFQNVQDNQPSQPEIPNPPPFPGYLDGSRPPSFPGALTPTRPLPSDGQIPILYPSYDPPPQPTAHQFPLEPLQRRTPSEPQKNYSSAGQLVGMTSGDRPSIPFSPMHYIPPEVSVRDSNVQYTTNHPPPLPLVNPSISSLASSSGIPSVQSSAVSSLPSSSGLVSLPEQHWPTEVPLFESASLGGHPNVHSQPNVINQPNLLNQPNVINQAHVQNIHQNHPPANQHQPLIQLPPPMPPVAPTSDGIQYIPDTSIPHVASIPSYSSTITPPRVTSFLPVVELPPQNAPHLQSLPAAMHGHHIAPLGFAPTPNAGEAAGPSLNYNTAPLNRPAKHVWRHASAQQRNKNGVADVEDDSNRFRQVVNPAYPPSAIAPALNYIFGLDDYPDAQQRFRPKGKTSNQGLPLGTPTTETFTGVPTQLGASDNRFPARGKDVQASLQPTQQFRPHNFNTSPDVELQHILMSLPPAFPLAGSQSQHPYLKKLSVSSSSTRQDSNDKSVVIAEPPHVAEPCSPTERRPQHDDSHSGIPRHGQAMSPSTRRDAFLWKLFVPQPPAPKGSPTLAHPSTSPRNGAQVLKETETPAVTTTDSNIGESIPVARLLIVVRRLPDKIIPTLNRTARAGEKGSGVRLDCGGELQDDADGFDVELADVPHIQWLVERNEFGLDFAQSFPSDLKRIVVADPNVSFCKLSKDAEVVAALRESLTAFLSSRDIIPVYLDECESAWSERYSEEVLAPLFHHRLPPVSTGFHYLDWSGYKDLNRLFLNAIVANFQQGDWILVFNYQLLLLPRMLRERPTTRHANIGFYLGTVFPSSEMYRILPQREELLRGVLAATFIGFHGFQYKRHFLTACTRVIGVECSGDRIEPSPYVGGGAGARVVTVPRGINPHPWLKELQKSTTQAKISELREKFKGRKVLLGIDTLDYTKGIPNKMLAFNKFLTDHPEWASRVVFFQICVPKGSGIHPETAGVDQDAWISRVDRREILANLYQLVGSINANFGNILNQPVHFLLSSLSVENLVCLYGLADIAVITPLRESLSWTAYEFVLCQSFTKKGVIILSEFSGSVQSLGAAALCVNPWDPSALATAIHDALIMPEEEKIERHEYAYDYVLNYDSQSWGRNLIEEFKEAVADLDAEKRSIPPPLPMDSLIVDMFQTAQHKFIILGLQGTLIPPTYRGIGPPANGKVRLTKGVEAALSLLGQDPNVSVLIVSSSTVALMNHAVEHLEGVGLMAENGHFERHSNHRQKHLDPSALSPHESVDLLAISLASLSPGLTPAPPTWAVTIPDIDLTWMDPVDESCRYFEQRTPGSVVIRTATSVSFNYFNAQRDLGANQARDLLIHLWAGPATLSARTDVVVGPHSVEVRSAASSKASAVDRWIREVLIERELDVKKCMVLCVANFLPRDEDVFSTLDRICDLNEHDSVLRHSYSDITDGLQRSGTGSFASVTPAMKDEARMSTDCEQSEGCVLTCSVGLKASRADYFLSNEKEVEQLLVLLGALSVLNTPEKFNDALQFDIKPTAFPTVSSSRELPTVSASKPPELRNPKGSTEWLLNSPDIGSIRKSKELQRVIVNLAGSRVSTRLPVNKAHHKKQLPTPLTGAIVSRLGTPPLSHTPTQSSTGSIFGTHQEGRRVTAPASVQCIPDMRDEEMNELLDVDDSSEATDDDDDDNASQVSSAVSSSPSFPAMIPVFRSSGKTTQDNRRFNS